MPRRQAPVVEFPVRPPPGPVAELIDSLRHVLGKMVSWSSVALLLEAAGLTITDAAGGAGTALTATRTMVDFGDAGIDSVRVVVRGKNSAAGSVTVQVYDVTNSAVLASAVVTGVAEQTAVGPWTALTPVGEDAEIEVRVVGNAADDPVLYAVQFQTSTTQKRA